MVKSFGKFIIIVLVVIGGINFYSLNKPAFKAMSETVSNKPASEIPGGVLTTVTHHNWKFLSKS